MGLESMQPNSSYEAIIDILYDVGKVKLDQRIDSPDDTIVDWELVIHYATRIGSHQKLKWLLNRGCNVNSRNSIGETPLMLACNNGKKVNYTIIHTLMAHESNIHIKNWQNQTALHYAATTGNIAVLRLLFECGSDKNLRDKDGKTPLHICIEKNHTFGIEYLSKCCL